MKTPLAAMNFNFVSKPDETQSLSQKDVYEGVERMQLPFPSSAGSAFVEMFPLAVGMSFGRGEYAFTEKTKGQLIPYFHTRGALSEPILQISMARTGRVIIKDFCIGADFQFGKGFILIRHLDRLDYQTILDASADIETTLLFISLSSLHLLMGQDITDRLLDALHISSAPAAAVCAPPAQILSLAFSGLNDHLTGQMRRLHAQAKVLEFLSALVYHLVYEEQQARPTHAINKKLIEQLHDELLDLEGKVPTLDELAHQYGISIRTLNECFKRQYGDSIYAHISQQRLAAAHEALVNTDIPMKTLAINLGYTHVNNFINAFRKKYGYSPGSLRRKGADIISI